VITVTVYYHEKGPELDQLFADLDSLQAIVPHQRIAIDLASDRDLREKIGKTLPLIQIGPYRLNPPFTRQDLQIMLSAARDRVGQLEQVDNTAYQQKVLKGRTLSSSDRLSLWLSRHYLALVNVLILVYVGLPFLAPVLLKNGITLPANAIYRVYGAMCHQLAFRSFFLFGEQPYYPRELAGIKNVISYETLQNTKNIDLLAAREFLGNPVVGYKVALCERDVAIYAFMLIFGIFFGIFKRRLRSIHWMVWVVIGLGPIGLDGGSQLLSFLPGLASWFPARESTPLLRVLTGGLFGWMTAWYLFPMLEDTARETRQIVQRKIAIISQIGQTSEVKTTDAV
jgi:uncharacterized membrane protein